MTGAELQSRLVRRIERHYEALAATIAAEGMEPERAHTLALKDTLRLLAEALKELRARGLFPWREGDAGHV